MIFLSQIILLRWLAFLLGFLTVTALLDLFISSNASICSTMAFSSLENSDHVVVSVSIDFQINSKWDALFHCIAYDYSHADRDGLCDHLRYVPLEDIFKLSNSADGGEFCECIQTGIDMYILQCKYQVKSNSSPWFSAACTAAMVHRNQFFVCTNRLNLLNLKYVQTG